jgi:hypothetical protein
MKLALMNPFWQRTLTETRPVLCPTQYLILVLLYDGRRYFELRCVQRMRRPRTLSRATDNLDWNSECYVSKIQ